PARDQREVRRLLAEHSPLVEHPLHRAAGKADEHLVGDDAIEPEIDRDDGRRLGTIRRLERGEHGFGRIDEYLRQRKPRDGRDDYGSSENLLTYSHPGRRTL